MYTDHVSEVQANPFQGEAHKTSNKSKEAFPHPPLRSCPAVTGSQTGGRVLQRGDLLVSCQARLISPMLKSAKETKRDVKIYGNTRKITSNQGRQGQNARRNRASHAMHKETIWTIRKRRTRNDNRKITSILQILSRLRRLYTRSPPRPGLAKRVKKGGPKPPFKQ